MKKGVFVIITLLAVLSQVFTPTFAAVSEKWSTNNVSTEIVGTKTGTVVQPMGIKSWIVKKSLVALAWSLDAIWSIRVFQSWWVAASVQKYSTVIRNTLLSLSQWESVSLSALQDQMVWALMWAWCSRAIATNIAFAIKELVQIVYL